MILLLTELTNELMLLMVTNTLRLAELAQYIKARLYGDRDKNVIITKVSSISRAQTGHITFLKDYRFRSELTSCAASAVILSEENLVFCPPTIIALVVKDPYLAYVKIAQLLNTAPTLDSKIASGAIIAPDAILGKRVGIGHNVVIESGVILSDDVKIGSGSFIGKNVKIGIGTYLWSNVTIHHAIEIGEYCVIQSGSVIGSDGFGYLRKKDIWIKVPQLGRVKIGNYVEIGACTTVDRGTIDDTYIKNGVIIDNQCQIAHNVEIGEYTAIAGGVVMAGSLTIGQHCMIGGASVINGHISICDRVTITGMSMVTKSIKVAGIYSSGIPVQPNSTWRKTTVLIMNIKNINQRIKNIEHSFKKYYYLKIIIIIFCLILLGFAGFVLLIRFFFS